MAENANAGTSTEPVESAHAWHKKGQAAQGAGRFEDARRLYAEGLAHHPDNPALVRALAHLEFVTGNPASAEARLRPLTARPDVQPGLRQTRAQALRALGREDEATRELDALEREAPNHPLAFERRIDALRGAGRNAEALALCETAIERHPNEKRFRIRRARITALLGDPDGALAILDGLAEGGKVPLAAADNRVAILEEAGRRDDARRALEALAAHHPRHPATFVKRAARLLAEGEAEAAVALVAEALAGNPRHTALVREHARALAAAGRRPEAIARLREAVVAAPEEPALKVALGRTLAAEADEKAAAAALAALEGGEDAAAVATPDPAEAPDEAIAFYEDALDRHPGHPALLAALADRRRARGDRRGAADTLRRSAVRPGAPVGHLVAWINDLVALDCPKTADWALERLAERAPDSPKLPLLAGRAALRRGDTAAARDRFREALAGDPLHAVGQLADGLVEVGDLEGVRSLLAAVEAAPATPARLGEIADLRARLRMTEEACAAIAAAREAAPDDPATRRKEVGILLRCGRIFDAEEALAAARGHADDDLPTLRHAARAAWLLGRSEEAIERARGILARADTVDARSQLLNFLVQSGRVEEAERLAAAAPRVADPVQRAKQLVDRTALAAARFDHARAVEAAREAVALAPRHRPALSALARWSAARLDTRRAWPAVVALERLGAFAKRLSESPLDRPRLSHLGQLLNEYDLEPEETARIAGLLAAPPRGDLTGLRSFVASAPGSTGAAIAFLATARRAGLLETPDAADGRSAIPRILHQYWDASPPPPAVARMTEHARANNPGWRHRLYDDRAAQAFLADVAGSAVRRVFRLARLPAHRADILRLALLAAEGGVYLDVDDLCFGPLDRLLPAGAGLVVYQEPGGAIANNFLAAVPGHPVLAGALEEVCETFLHYSNESIWLSSGPGLVTRHVARHLAARAAAGSGDIVVHPIHAMRRAVSMHLPMDHKARANDWRAVSLATRAA